MVRNIPTEKMFESECGELVDEQRSGFQVSRRGFLQILGAGLLVTVTERVSFGEGRAHRLPSDVVRTNMLYGRILRPPSYGATLSAIDLSEAKAVNGVIVVSDGDCVGCAAPTSFRAAQALQAVARTASREMAPHTSSKELFSYLKKHARPCGGGRRGCEAERAAPLRMHLEGPAKSSARFTRCRTFSTPLWSLGRPLRSGTTAG